MRFSTLALPFAALCLSLGACQMIYKLPTRQGNVIEQKQLDQLKTGMSREQVQFLLGTPIAASPFRADRWDYLGFYKSPRGQISKRTVTLYFDNDALARMEGVAATTVNKDLQLGADDAKAVIQQEKKDKVESERAKEDTSSGVILSSPPSSSPDSAKP